MVDTSISGAPSMLAAGESSTDAEWEGSTALTEPCLIHDSMGVHACNNRHQCFEPCGELGHSAEHARRAPPEVEKQVDEILGIETVTLRLPKELVSFYKEVAFSQGLADEKVAMKVMLQALKDEAINPSSQEKTE